MRDVIARIVDGSRFREFKKEYGSTILTVRDSSGHEFNVSTDAAVRRRDSHIFTATLWASLRITESSFHRRPSRRLTSTVFPAPDPTTLSCKCHWIHGWLQGREGWYRQGWCQDGPRCRMRRCTRTHRRYWWEFRRRELRCGTLLSYQCAERLTLQQTQVWPAGLWVPVSSKSYPSDHFAQYSPRFLWIWPVRLPAVLSAC
jgi:hypothetical protein